MVRKAMTSSLEFIFTVTVIGILSVFYISNKPKPEPKSEPEPIPEPERIHDPILALDWMLANNIIDTREYNQLIVKCLPFLE